MPLVLSKYEPTAIFKNGDISTIYAATLRNVVLTDTVRERITLSDGDFIDLDWNYTKEPETNKLIVLLHGLGGNSKRPYMKGMVRSFTQRGWDAVAMNLRGCSEELNRLFRSYHAGASHDLEEVISHIKSKFRYSTICLVGFSLGGNIVLKYLGEDREIPQEIKGAVTISVPCDLAGSLGEISRMRNFIYSKRFQSKLKSDLLIRARKFPKQLSANQINNCHSLRDIDELYTSKAHGFKNADAYYAENSSLQFLGDIKHPVLLINAKNDSFLCPSSYPIETAKRSDHLHLQVPDYGGHVGFVFQEPDYFHEREACKFLEELC